ncbi:MAG: hypothetical protein WCO67_02690 [Betaproteobacteria bacterium]
MKKLLKTPAINILGLGRVYPTALTTRDAILPLIESLHPLDPGVPLIRMGPPGDGGYLVPDDLAGVEACFSPGVSLISGFEKDCANLGMKVFMADRSVERPADSHELFHFTRKYVGATTSEDFMTVDNWVAACLPGSRGDLILQIDIEGFEYETFLSMSDALMSRFRIIVAEFHDLDQLWNRPFFHIASSTFQKILQTHTCVHIHPNNNRPLQNTGGLSIPPQAEFTFLRKDRMRSSSFATVFPHPLDGDNTANPHYALPDCWHGK